MFDPASGADSFNPLDVLSFMPALDLEDALSILLEPLRPAEAPSFAPGWPSGLVGEPGWRVLAIELFESLVRYQLRRKKHQLSLVEVIKVFFQDDVVYKLAVLLDTEQKLMEPAVYGVISAFLQRIDQARSVILGLIQGAISGLNAASVQRAVERTTFDLGAVAAGGATIYVEAPPQSWRSHGPVVRLWLSALLHLAAAGAGRGRPALFVVDDAAGLGLFPQLRLAQYLPAGAAEVWSFWESLGQLQAGHPADWSAFVGSCRSVQALGPQSPAVAAELTAAFGVTAAELTRLAPGARWAPRRRPARPGPAPRRPRAGARPAAPWGHMVTFAPARADRWAAVAAELRERPDRSVVIVESAGACHARTAADREARGRVVRLDPFGVLGQPADQFNPLDLLSTSPPMRQADVYQFTELLVQAGVPSTDPVWQGWTVSLIRAVLQYILSVPEKARTLGTLWDTFHSDDIVYNLAVVLDTIGKGLPPRLLQGYSSFS